MRTVDVLSSPRYNLRHQPVISVEYAHAIQADSISVWTREVLPYVQRLSSEDDRLRETLELLRAWDGRAGRDSTAAALFETFRLRLIDAALGDELGSDLLEMARSEIVNALPHLLLAARSPWFDDVRTSESETRDDSLLTALEEAVEELSEAQGVTMTRWRWGDVHAASFENQSLGQCGIRPIESRFNCGPLAVDGTPATVNQGDYHLREPYAVQSVASYRQIIDLADLSRSVAMHTTGQSGHPFHRHNDDMIAAWRDVEHHPMLWTRAEVEAHAEGTLVLTP